MSEFGSCFIDIFESLSLYFAFLGIIGFLAIIYFCIKLLRIVISKSSMYKLHLYNKHFADSDNGVHKDEFVNGMLYQQTVDRISQKFGD